MAMDRRKAKGRRESGIFVPLPCSVLNHPNFTRLSAKAVKLLIDMVSQLRFRSGGTRNNGDLTATWSILKERGWKSRDSLHLSLQELLYYGFIKLTRQGGRHLPSLYAVTWWAIDECGGKLDIPETRAPSNEWKIDKKPWQRPKRK
jgi:hypothetical protein